VVEAGTSTHGGVHSHHALVTARLADQGVGEDLRVGGGSAGALVLLAPRRARAILFKVEVRSPLESKGLKPGFHFIDSRVESRRLMRIRVADG
jgi:hypothetical protein